MAKRVADAPPEVDSESDDSEGESTKRLYDKSNKTMIAEWKGDVARLLELPWAKNMLKRLRKYADADDGERGAGGGARQVGQAGERGRLAQTARVCMG